MNKKFGLVATTALCAIVLVACGGNEKKTAESSSVSSSSSSVESSSKKKEAKKESSSSESKESSSSKDKSDSAEFDAVVAGIKKNIDAKEINVLHASMEPQIFNQDYVTVSLDGYEMLELNDFKQDYASSFRNNSDYAGILLAKYTVTNTGTEDAYYFAIQNLSYSGAKRSYTNSLHIMTDDVDNFVSLLLKKDGKLAPGESVTGFVPFTIDGDSLDKMKDLTMVTMEIPSAYKTEEIKNENKLGEVVKVDLPVTSDGEGTLAEKGTFYGDKATVDNMGTKTLLKEKKDINETLAFGEADVTLNGYQFTEFVPNETEAPRFRDFENGIVLMTASLTIKNNGDEVVAPSRSSSVLNVNNNAQRILSSSMLLATVSDDEVKKGEADEWIQVFAFDKEQYDKIWKEKDFSLKVNLRQESGSLRKGEDITFDLPK